MADQQLQGWTQSHALLGRAAQWGCVVRDIEAGMRDWTRLLGIGPWILVRDFSAYSFTHRGQVVFPQLTVAITYFGDIQVELIEQRNDAPSPYREFLSAGREGIQHLGFWPADFAAARAAVEASGHAPVFFAQPNAPVNPTIYFEAPERIGPMIELSEIPEPRKRAYARMRELAENWDGSQPVREFSSLATLFA